MNLGFGSTPYGMGTGYATVPSYDQLMPMQPPKRSWQSRLYDRMMPQQQDGLLPLDDKDKKALVRQGLLQMGIGLLQHNNMAQGLGAGLQGGLLSMQQGAENIADRQMRQRMMAQSGYGMPQEFRSVDMMARAAGHEPGTEGYRQFMRVAGGTEGRASSAGIGFQKVMGADGRERMGRTNPRSGQFEVYDEATGDFVPMGGAHNAPRPGVYIDPSLPPFVRQQIEAAEASGQQVPDLITDGAVVPPQPVANPRLGASRAPEEQAALTTAAQEQAKIDAQLRNSPAVATAEANAAAQKAAAEAAAKAQAERNAAMSKKTLDADKTLDLLEEAEVLVPLSTGSRGGAIVDDVAAFAGHSTDGAKAIGALKTIAGQLTSNMPRMEGPQGVADVELYKQMAGDLANPTIPVETRMAALAQIRRLNRKYASNPGAVDVKPSTSITKAKRQEKRRGKYQGRTVIEYTDGSVEYAD